jgi:alpha-galactosidase
MNKEVIAVNQDSLGIQGLKAETKDGLEVWFKPLVDGDWAFCILNRNKTAKEYTIYWQRFNLDDEVASRSTGFYSTIYNIRNLWSKKSEGTTSKNLKVTIPAQDVVMFRLSPKK